MLCRRKQIVDREPGGVSGGQIGRPFEEADTRAGWYLQAKTQNPKMIDLFKDKNGIA
jgi:hypothetical protein